MVTSDNPLEQFVLLVVQVIKLWADLYEQQRWLAGTVALLLLIVLIALIGLPFYVFGLRRGKKQTVVVTSPNGGSTRPTQG